MGRDARGDKPSTLPYVPALDGLRGIAIILVLALHYSLLPCGWIGVQIFFVLSGYLITKILLQEKTRPLGEYLKRFYVRRSLRIFPLYFFFLLATTALYVTLAVPRSLASYWPYLYTYTFNLRGLSGLEKIDIAGRDPFYHLWSLSVEEQFYLVWPFLVFSLSQKNFRRTLMAILIVAPLLRWAVVAASLAWGRDSEFARIFVYYFTPCQADAFASGGLLAILPQLSLKKSQTLFVFSFLLLALAGWFNQVGGVNFQTLDFGYPLHMFENYQYLWGYSLLNFFSFSLLAFFLAKPDEPPSLLRRGLRRLGKVSYGTYMLHLLALLPFQLWVLRSGVSAGSYLGCFLLYVLLAWLLAELSYRYLEVPFLRLKERKY